MRVQEKPAGSFFVPYTFIGSEIYVFLQKRSFDAPRNPGLTGLFGGGFERGENPDEAFLREVFEELNYVPQEYYPLGVYYSGDIMHIFAEEVGSDFEGKVVVNEGEGGVFVNLGKLNDHPIPSRHVRVLKDLCHYLANKDALLARI